MGRTSAGKESDLANLLEFLQTEVQRRERSQTFSTINPNSERVTSKQQRPGSATSLVSQQASPRHQSCLLCGKKGHDIAKCYGWQDLTFEQRHQKVKDLELCFRCLKKNCQASVCKKFCTNKDCHQGRHHVILCKKKLAQESNSDLVNETTVDPNLLSAKPHKQIIMQIAKIPIYNHNKKKCCICKCVF